MRGERTARKAAEHAAAALPEKDAALTAANAERDRAVAATEKMKASMFNTLVRAQAMTAGLHEKAIPDALRAVREIFVVNDDGAIVPKDADARITLVQYFAASRVESPHWHPATASGSGAMQSHSIGASNRAISRRQFDAMRPAQQAALMQTGATTIVD